MQNNNHPPLIVGTGLICLDAIEPPNNGYYTLFAGGSCLNPLIILSTRGWHGFPIGMIGQDKAGDYVMNDTSAWPIDQRYILQRKDIQTPLYIQQIDNDGHRFIHTSPSGKRYPSYEPLDTETMKQICDELPSNIDVCLIERVSPASIELIRACKARGAMVYLELNRTGEQNEFVECLKHADVFKYSQEKLSEIHELTDTFQIPLEIKTKGKEGLAYRHWQKTTYSEWHHLPSILSENIIDAAGAGDWLTATLIDVIGKGGSKGFKAIPSDLYADYLNQGQQKSVENCKYIGARGLLYKNKIPLRGIGFCPYGER